jgi:hypothetical protein
MNQLHAVSTGRKEQATKANFAGGRMALWEVKRGKHVDTIAMLKHAADSHHGCHAISRNKLHSRDNITLNPMKIL